MKRVIGDLLNFYSVHKKNNFKSMSANNSIYDFFVKGCESCGDIIAIIDPSGKEISYSSLIIEIEAVSNSLVELLNSQKSVVAIEAVKSSQTIILVLACIKTEIPYVILDPSLPRNRLISIIKKSGLKFIFSEKNTINVGEINSWTFFKDFYFHEVENTLIQTIDNRILYIMFTSGSTGEPKGAMIGRDGLIEFIRWAKKEFQIKKGDRVSSINPLYFDNSVFDIYTSLFNQATLIICPDEITKNPSNLIDFLNDKRCVQWFSVPSLLIFCLESGAFQARSMTYLKRIIFGGEAFPKTKLRNLVDTLGKEKDYFNVYGPTECTCMCSSYKIQESEFIEPESLMPLGNISDYFKYEISDSGELFLGGDAVGFGYVSDNIQSTKNFFDKLLDGSRVRFYKTGDIVKISPRNNMLYFVSRKDHQIKHMGYRIELNEIEFASTSFDYIRESIALYVKHTSGYSYICLAVGSKIPDRDSLIKDLKKKLPVYMLPRRIIIQDVLVKNKNGKIDRQYYEKLFEQE